MCVEEVIVSGTRSAAMSPSVCQASPFLMYSEAQSAPSALCYAAALFQVPHPNRCTTLCLSLCNRVQEKKFVCLALQNDSRGATLTRVTDIRRLVEIVRAPMQRLRVPMPIVNLVVRMINDAWGRSSNVRERNPQVKFSTRARCRLCIMSRSVLRRWRHALSCS